jgi:OOP family OmpA-OmpF porin
VTAAIALARFDCWVERAAERATPAHVAKCRGDFIDVMREIEDRSAPAADRIAVRFAYDHLALAPAEREKIAHAARTALERNAIVSVAALTMAQGHETIEARMAWRRAEAVAGQLTALGVPAERIRLLSRAAHSNEREARTRRVDIVLD